MDEVMKLLDYLEIQSPQVREIMRESAVVRWRWFQNTYPDLQNVTLSRIRAKQSEAAEDT